MKHLHGITIYFKRNKYRLTFYDCMQLSVNSVRILQKCVYGILIIRSTVLPREIQTFYRELSRILTEYYRSTIIPVHNYCGPALLRFIIILFVIALGPRIIRFLFAECANGQILSSGLFKKCFISRANRSL